MRLRNIPGSREAISESPFVVQEPESKRGSWNLVFQNSHPLHIEVGMGKGQFLMEMARRNPDVNYLGIEMYDSVLLRALQKENRKRIFPTFLLSAWTPENCPRFLPPAKWIGSI